MLSPRFARFERWRREVVPDLRLQLDVWGAEIYLMLSTAQKTLWMQEQQTQDLLRVKPDTDRQAAAAGAIVESMRGILQDALSNVQRLYEKRYQQVEVSMATEFVWFRCGSGVLLLLGGCFNTTPYGGSAKYDPSQFQCR